MDKSNRLEVIHKFTSMDDVTLAYVNYLYERMKFFEDRDMPPYVVQASAPVAMQASAPPTSRREDELLEKNVALEEENRALKNKPDYQTRVNEWAIRTWPPEVRDDTTERALRFAEEAIELMQSMGLSLTQIMDMMFYVYGRPIGTISDEVGGVMITLAMLCTAMNLDLTLCAEMTLHSANKRVGEIQTKNKKKPDKIKSEAVVKYQRRKQADNE